MVQKSTQTMFHFLGEFGKTSGKDTRIASDGKHHDVIQAGMRKKEDNERNTELRLYYPRQRWDLIKKNKMDCPRLRTICLNFVQRHDIGNGEGTSRQEIGGMPNHLNGITRSLKTH